VFEGRDWNPGGPLGRKNQLDGAYRSSTVVVFIALLREPVVMGASVVREPVVMGASVEDGGKKLGLGIAKTASRDHPTHSLAKEGAAESSFRRFLAAEILGWLVKQPRGGTWWASS
jgi:hypothetical protein